MNITRLVEWAKADRARCFEVRFIAAIKHPWAVRLDNDLLSWSVTADAHGTLGQAIDDALQQAAAEEGRT